MKETSPNSTTNTTKGNHDCYSGNGGKLSSEELSGKEKLRKWLNRFLRIKMTDGRILTGAFLCTDRDANVILGSCEEFLSDDHSEARVLGLVMVPGRHIVSIHLDVWCNEDGACKKKTCPSASE